MATESKQISEDAAHILHSAADYAANLKKYGGCPRWADYEFYRNRLHKIDSYNKDSELARVLGV